MKTGITRIVYRVLDVFRFLLFGACLGWLWEYLRHDSLVTFFESGEYNKWFVWLVLVVVVTVIRDLLPREEDVAAIRAKCERCAKRRADYERGAYIRATMNLATQMSNEKHALAVAKSDLTSPWAIWPWPLASWDEPTTNKKEKVEDTPQ